MDDTRGTQVGHGVGRGVGREGLKEEDHPVLAVEAHHHPRQRRTCARSNTTETIKIAVNGTIVFCLNPDDIPKSLCLCSDPALARRVMILLHETRFVSADVFASLSPENQTSGFYAIADDALISHMNSPALLWPTLSLLLVGKSSKTWLCSRPGLDPAILWSRV